jgi:hypothetical protein
MRCDCVCVASARIRKFTRRSTPFNLQISLHKL